jgi:4-hydroxy-4-methyl-2-oxoglutarate aldolase
MDGAPSAFIALDPVTSTSNSLAVRLERVGTALLADVLDALGHRSSFLGTGIAPLVPGWRVAGTAVTLRCEPSTPGRSAEAGGDYHALFQVLGAQHPGSVLVIAGAEHETGLWGELLSTAAVARGCVGAVIDGATRDVQGIVGTGLRVFARGVSPLDSAGRQHFAEHGVTVRIGQAEIAPGDWIVGDELGVIVVPTSLVERAIELAETKMDGESTVRDELRAGDDLRTVFDRHGIL